MGLGPKPYACRARAQEGTLAEERLGAGALAALSRLVAKRAAPPRRDLNAALAALRELRPKQQDAVQVCALAEVLAVFAALQSAETHIWCIRGHILRKGHSSHLRERYTRFLD